MKRVGIIGFGVIGQAINDIFRRYISEDFRVYPYDPNIDALKSDGHKERIDKCDIAFVCVPTPHNKYEGLDMSIIESVIDEFDPGTFVICSALQPGTADRLMEIYGKRIVVQPEYFGETTRHPLTNISQSEFMILGGHSDDVNDVIKLYQIAYNANIRIRKVSALEAEVIKLSENRAIAYKVSQCQELYDVCKEACVDYETVRQAVYGDDPRFNLWWTFVYEEDRGLNSKCIPKDVYGWYKWAKDSGIEPKLTGDLLKYNDKLIKE
jgi:UDPglucose 6-dehydrogenase